MPTKLLPCPDAITCEGTDSPFVNLTAEEPDVPVYKSDAYGKVGAVECLTWQDNPDSQIEADDAARNDNDACTHTPENPEPPDYPLVIDEPPIVPPPVIDGPPPPPPPPVTPPPPTVPPPVIPPPVVPPPPNPPPFQPPTPPVIVARFWNTEQTWDYTCPNGDTWTAICRAHTISSAVNQAIADAIALARVKDPSQNQPMCMTDIAPKICINEEYNQQITVSGLASGFTWSLTSGNLPTGTTLFDGNIFGTCTAAGVYTFTIKAEWSTGRTSHTYTVRVEEITTTSPLPDVTPGVPYSATLVLDSGESPVLWGLIDGMLPTGLVLDGDTGVISGTVPADTGSGPNPGGDYAFTVCAQDKPPSVTCCKYFELTVLPAVLPVSWVWGAPTVILETAGFEPTYTLDLDDGQYHVQVQCVDITGTGAGVKSRGYIDCTGSGIIMGLAAQTIHGVFEFTHTNQGVQNGGGTSCLVDGLSVGSAGNSGHFTFPFTIPPGVIPHTIAMHFNIDSQSTKPVPPGFIASCDWTGSVFITGYS